jgi:hypothetical protein
MEVEAGQPGEAAQQAQQAQQDAAMPAAEGAAAEGAAPAAGGAAAAAAAAGQVDAPAAGAAAEAQQQQQQPAEEEEEEEEAVAEDPEAEGYLVECVTYTARMLETMLTSAETAKWAIAYSAAFDIAARFLRGVACASVGVWQSRCMLTH